MTNRLVYAYLAASISIIVAELGAVVVLRIYKVEVDQMLLAQLMGIGTPSVFALFAFIRGIGNSQELARNTQLTVETKKTLERIEGS